MKLYQLKTIFDKFANDDFVFTESFHNPMSWRGIYDELAFEPSDGNSVKQIKEFIKNAYNDRFYGYKGGEYEYNDFTDVNLDYYANYTVDANVRFEALISRMVLEYMLSESGTFV